MMIQQSKKVPTSSEQTSSKDDHQTNFRASLKEDLFFEIDIKRQSKLLSKWKKRNCNISYLPQVELSLTIKLKDKDSIEEIINLRNTKISKRCSVVEGHNCFGMEISNGKRYLIARETESKIIVLFENIVRLKKYFKDFSKTPESTPLKMVREISHPQLQFERSNYEQSEQKKQKINQDRTTKIEEVDPRKSSSLCQKLEFERELQSPQKRIKVQIPEEDQEYKTAMEDESKICEEEEHLPIEEEEPLPIEEFDHQIHLKTLLRQQEFSYISSDQGFKLLENFKEGRILSREKQLFKSNLILKTHLNQFELMQSFFHLELWNGRTVKYQVINRVDSGIYLVYLELKKNHFWNKNHYCYLMATSLTFRTQPFIILKSLNKSDFEPVSGCNWIDLTLWASARSSEQDHLHKSLSVCLQIGQLNSDTGLLFIEQIKGFQSFLYTTHSLPFKVLQWRNDSWIQS